MRAAFIILGLIITTLANAEIVMESYGSGAKEYWIIYDDAIEHSENLVVFLHGHGANNPAPETQYKVEHPLGRSGWIIGILDGFFGYKERTLCNDGT